MVWRERIAGILLAAGASRRMGEPKPLLPFGNATVLEQCVENLQEGSVERIIIVLGFASERIRRALPDLFERVGIRGVVNERHEDGMLSSVQCGVRAAYEERPDGFLLSLVDQPFVTAATVRAVVEAFRTTERRVVVPTFAGRRGHPVGLDASLRDAILALDSRSAGLRDLIGQLSDDTLLVPVGSDDALRDMDTPDDYRRELERWSRRKDGL
jgi:molybdenum cofactor cytidylyltransferase